MCGILKKELKGNYVGYELQSIYPSDDKPFEYDDCRKLKRIPRKISYFFDKSKISEVRKTDYAKLEIDNYYLIKTTKDKYVMAIY